MLKFWNDFSQETNYTENLDKLEDLVSKLENEENIIRSIDPWFMQFKAKVFQRL